MHQRSVALILAGLWVLVVACGGTAQKSSTPATTTSPPVAVGALDGLLPSAADINTAMGATAMTVTQNLNQMRDFTARLSDKACLVAYSAQLSVYSGSGYTAVRGQELREPGQNSTHEAAVAVVLFPTAAEAATFFNSSTQSWASCSNRKYTDTPLQDQPAVTWTVGAVSNANGTLSLQRYRESGNGNGCSRGLTVRNNVAVDVSTCATPPGDSAVTIAHQIAAKVGPSTPGGQTSSTTPPPTVAPDRLDSVLLTTDQLNTLLGASGLQVSRPITHNVWSGGTTVSNPDCLEALHTAQDTVYQGSGYTAVSFDQVSSPDHIVTQAAVSFPWAETALDFVKTSADKLRACTGQAITETTSNGAIHWTIGPVVGDVPTITQLSTVTGNGPSLSCQRALSAVRNLVIDVEACNESQPVGDQARQIADEMAANATH